MIVVGAGAIGQAIAWRCAQQGLDVQTVDPEPGQHASWVSAGMLAPVTEVHFGEQMLLELNLASSRRWPEFATELGDYTDADVGYRECGVLTAARDQDDNAVLDDLFTFQRKLGLDVERLRGHECRELEPALAPTVRGGILAADDHQVDPRRLLAALGFACQRAGVRHRTRAAVKCSGRDVVLDDGAQLEADVVVVAAGAWMSRLVDTPAGNPVRPVKGQIVRLRNRGPALATRTIRGLDVYIVIRPDGEIVIGATSEEQGFDTSLTAGAVHKLFRAASELLPNIIEIEFVEASAGLRPGSPDNAPLIGRACENGPVLAAGHYRNGILLTPITADLVAEYVTTSAMPSLGLPFDPARFN